jgi:SepF-like predicted cell division protein (DUF552 family)
LSCDYSYCSAYHQVEYVIIFPVIVSKAKLINIAVKVTDANLMILADDAALQKRPKAFYRVCMDMADSVGDLMIDGFVVDDF